MNTNQFTSAILTLTYVCVCVLIFICFSYFVILRIVNNLRLKDNISRRGGL
ncbi:6-kDa hydrophobic protein [Citrus associated ampelovirus 1]|nr:6-kDa hydrophobic protein [Citrus associated ampelovirus 1]QSE37557.1 6-kDa hydrophobic protein [Citrus associated ampelovirus 1]